MTVQTKPLLTGVVIVTEGGMTTRELVEVIDTQNRAIAELQAQIAAIAEVTAPSGGGTQDAEARAAINSIISAAS